MHCSFCHKNMEKGTGKIFSTKEGEVYPFCSRKCEMNLRKLKRKPHETKWTDLYKKEKEIKIHGKTEKKVKKAEKVVKKKTTKKERREIKHKKRAEKKKKKVKK